MGRLDLDARRAEYADERHVVVLADREWELPARFPLMVAQHLQAGQVDKAIVGLFGDDSLDVLAPLLNDDDLESIMSELYDLDTDRERVSVKPSVQPTSRTNGAAKRAKARR